MYFGLVSLWCLNNCESCLESSVCVCMRFKYVFCWGDLNGNCLFIFLVRFLDFDLFMFYLYVVILFVVMDNWLGFWIFFGSFYFFGWEKVEVVWKFEWLWVVVGMFNWVVMIMKWLDLFVDGGFNFVNGFFVNLVDNWVVILDGCWLNYGKCWCSGCFYFFEIGDCVVGGGGIV